MKLHPEITNDQLEAIARHRGFKLIDLDDYEYDMHQEHNAGVHDDIVTDCPDCAVIDMEQHLKECEKAIR